MTVDGREDLEISVVEHPRGARPRRVIHNGLESFHRRLERALARYVGG